MSKYISIIACLMFSLAPSPKAQPVNIQVADSATGRPIGGASLHWGALHLATNAAGWVLLPQRPPAAALLISAVGYHPQTHYPTQDTFLLIKLLPMAAELQDVVVSGNMKPMRRLESAIPVESYSQAFLKQNPTPGLFEGVAMMNGVQPQITCNVCNTGDIRINGLEGPYTMILIDGMPIVSSLSTVYGLSGIPTSLIKRIEVVKGPAGTLYGSEAVGGLINIITKEPQSRNSLGADVNASTLGEVNIDLSASMATQKANVLVGANGFFFNTPHDINRDNFTDITLQNRLSVFAKLNWERPRQLQASLMARLLTERRWGGELPWQRKWMGTDSVYGETIDTRRAELIGQYGVASHTLLEYSYNFHWQDSYYGTTWFKASQHTAFAQLRWQKTIGRHQWLAGIPFRYVWYDDNTTATRKPQGNNPSIQTMKALFVQDEWKATNRLTALLGVRYEYNNLQGSVLAPRLALKYEPAAHHTLRLSAGNGFRMVNLFTEDHAAISGFREVVIKNDLKPEKSWNTNLNYSGDLHLAAGVLGWDLSAFYTRFSNKIIPNYDQDPNKIIYDNLKGHAISQGINGQLTLTFRNGIRALSGFTFMDVFAVENDLKSRQLFAPQWSGTYSVAFPMKKAGITLDLTGKWTGPMRLPTVPNDFRPEFSPLYHLMNVQATKRWRQGIETYLSIKNLFNFIPQNPILHPNDPFDRRGGMYWNTDGTPNQQTNPNGFTFDPSYNYAPMQGIKLLLGFRMTL